MRGAWRNSFPFLVDKTTEVVESFRVNSTSPVVNSLKTKRSYAGPILVI
ncbi:hypothetical protein BCAR13_520265 [Paraburkholderia caribensis]|nr:hypothetical protein BCAR13_520265 [Paraburkholderia caribensis]